MGGGITFYWVIIPVLLCAITDQKSWHLYMKWLSIGIFFAVALAIAQVLIGLDPENSPWRISTTGLQWDRARGFQSRPWVFSYLCSIAFLLFLSLHNDKNWWHNSYTRYSLIFLALLGMMLAQIRAPMIAIIIASSFFLIGRLKEIGLKKLLLGLTILITLFILAALMRENMFHSLSTGNGRLQIWQASLEVVYNNPIWGVGRPHFQELYISAWDVVHGPAKDKLAIYLQGSIGHPHQDYLSIAVYYGLPALFAYLGIIAALIRWTWSIRIEDPHTAKSMAAIISFVLIAGLAENYTDYTASFYSMIGAYIILYKRHQLFKLNRWKPLNYESTS